MNALLQLNAFWKQAELKSDLKSTSRLVYLALFQLNNRRSWKILFQATYSEILSMTGIANVKTYYSALDELVKGGYLEWHKSHNQYQAASFSIIMLYRISEEHKQNALPKNGRAAEERRKATRKSDGNILKPINDKPINIAFQVFWDLYDYKKDKLGCEKSWQKINDHEREAIIKNLPEYVKSTPDKTYRKHPKNYLNNRSWENEISTSPIAQASIKQNTLSPSEAFTKKKERNKIIDS